MARKYFMAHGAIFQAHAMQQIALHEHEKKSHRVDLALGLIKSIIMLNEKKIIMTSYFHNNLSILSKLIHN